MNDLCPAITTYMPISLRCFTAYCSSFHLVSSSTRSASISACNPLVFKSTLGAHGNFCHTKLPLNQKMLMQTATTADTYARFQTTLDGGLWSAVRADPIGIGP